MVNRRMEKEPMLLPKEMERKMKTIIGYIFRLFSRRDDNKIIDNMRKMQLKDIMDKRDNQDG
jgi:hypothetical protein